MEKFLFTIPVDEILSQNTYLCPKSRWINANGKKVLSSYLYKDPSVAKYQDTIINYIKSNYSELLLSNKDFFITDFSTYGYFEEFTYLLNHKISGRDLTNPQKLIEDAIVRAINEICQLETRFDDSQVYKQLNYKYDISKVTKKAMTDIKDKEIIIFSLSKINLEEIPEITI